MLNVLKSGMAVLVSLCIASTSSATIRENIAKLVQSVDTDAPVCSLCQHPYDLISHTQNLKPEVLKLALKAYEHAREEGLDKQGLITIIDYSLPSYTKRLWVIDVGQKKVLFNTLVAHGQGSGGVSPTVFSNKSKSLASSIGVFLTANPYQGHFGLAMRLKGLEKGFNDHAFARAIVMHSAWYVSEDFNKKYGHIGRSWGCLALDETVTKPVIKTIKNGTLLFAYYPDPKWLKTSSFLQ